MTLKFKLLQVIEKLKAMNTTMQFRLLNLPNELIAHVVEFVEDATALRRLACTCRQVQAHAEPVLYRSLLVRSGSRIKDVVDAIEARSERASAIHFLDVPCDSVRSEDITGVATLMMKAKNMKHLMIESPSCNSAEFEDEKAWRDMTEELFRPFHAAVGRSELSPRPLQLLTKLTLHLNGPESPYWTLDQRSLPIFLHPTLQDLKISCMNLPGGKLTSAKSQAHTTPLKHLVLEECNISHDGLHQLLSLPTALEMLFLGENCYNFRYLAAPPGPGYNHLFERRPATVINALSQQKHSLQTLTYATPEDSYVGFGDYVITSTPLNVAPVDGGFADFHKLEKVTLMGECPNFERALLTSRHPPNLRELRFEAENPLLALHRRHAQNLNGEDDNVLDFIPFLRAPSASIPPTLKTLNLLYEYSTYGGGLSHSRRSAIKAAAKRTFESLKVTLNVKYRERGHYYPPFLFGEPTPAEGMIYDGYRGVFTEDLKEPSSRKRVFIEYIWRPDD